MMKLVSLIFCLFLFLFSCCSATEETASKIEFETLFYDWSAHDLSTTSWVCSRAPTNGSKNEGAPKRLELVHGYGPCAGPKKEVALSLAEKLENDQMRVQSIQANIKKSLQQQPNDNEDAAMDYGPTQFPTHKGTYLGTNSYVVTISLGRPKQQVTLVFDTGSSLTWTQCQPCDCYPQKEPLFKPSASSTYSRISCTSPDCAELGRDERGGPGYCVNKIPDCPYSVTYGSSGATYSRGFYSSDRLTLPTGDVFRYFRFGCGTNNYVPHGQYAGVFGLGRGQQSFVSQTKVKYSRVFAYCLPLDETKAGFLAFGGEHFYKNVNGVLYTPFVPFPASEYYFISIIAIAVGGEQLSITESVLSSTHAIIDSGTAITHLPPDAYKVLRKQFKIKMNTLGYKSAPSHNEVLDTCFFINNDIKTIPTMSFTFLGGVEVKFAASGIIFYLNTRLACLAVAGNKNPNDLTIFGSLQQTSLEMVYDGPNNQLGFRNNPKCF